MRSLRERDFRRLASNGPIELEREYLNGGFRGQMPPKSKSLPAQGFSGFSKMTVVRHFRLYF